MKQDLDHKLTDKGWADMRKALDREMPERKKRRPVFWWWFGALLLLLAGGGMWALFERSQPQYPVPPPEVEPKAVQPVVSVPENEDKVTIDQAESEIKPGTAGHSQNAALASDPAVRQNKPATTNVNDTPMSPMPAITLPDVANTGVVSNRENADHVVATGAPGTKATPSLSALPVEISLLSAQRSFDMPVFATAIPPSKSTVKPHKNARWSFGLAAGLRSESFSAVNGFSAGMVLDWQPARKWGLRTGLQYAQYRATGSRPPIIAVNNDQYANATGNLNVVPNFADSLGNPWNGAGTSDTNGTPVLIPVKKLHKLEMPLLAFWQPVRPLRLYGGITATYNLSARASEQNYANETVFTASNAKELESINSLTSEVLPRFNIEAMLGLGFRFGKRMELNVFYRPAFGNDHSDAVQSNAFLDNSGVNWQPRGTDSRHLFFLNGILFF